MRRYEMMLLLRPDLNTEKKQEILKKFEESISKNGGRLETLNRWSENRPLAYTIRSRGAYKHKFDHADYILCYFWMPQEGLDKFKFDLNLIEEILRYLIIKRDKKNV